MNPASPVAGPWARFVAMPAADRRRLLLAVVSLPLIDLLLRVLDVPRTMRVLDRFSPLPPSVVAPPSGIDTAHRWAELIAIAGSRGLSNGTCLRQALLLKYWLRRRGHPAKVCVGVRTQGGFAAHAWVEVEGVAIGQRREVVERFVPLTGL